MSKVIKLKKGLDIGIIGLADKERITDFKADTYAIKPMDFKGIAPIPKLLVKEKDTVKVGDGLFYDKATPDILYTAPVSGEIVEIKRGAKRAITEIVIKSDGKFESKSFKKANPAALSREEIIAIMKESGLWPMLRQRPFNVIAESDKNPKAIFISGFDSAPLAPDYDFILSDKGEMFQAGIEALRKLTTGKIHLSYNAKSKKSDVLLNTKGVELHAFKGPHPAGNVGIQIHHIDPINKGDIVWTINPQDVVTLGILFSEGKYNSERIVSLNGPEVKKPGYYRTHIGACIKGMIENNLYNNHVRCISGNVLTGSKIDFYGHMGFYSHHVSVIAEGDKYEFLGWILPSYPRPSLSKTFWTGILANMGFHNDYAVNTNTHGEKRAFVMTGQYEQVLPMDIYPVQLLKSIMYKDFEEMEGLGIYEVVEEDLALCEFVCTSKMNVQQILREGLNEVKAQG